MCPTSPPLGRFALSGGQWKGHSLRLPPPQWTRPTQSKWRQAWFNALQSQVPHARVLDLFAGSGALGFEALSRGAEFVLAVEKHPTVFQILRENAKRLPCEGRFQAECQDVFSPTLWKPQEPFDLLFADPPYAQGWEKKFLQEFPFSQWLKEGAWVCLEWSLGRKKTGTSQEELLPPPALRKIRERQAHEVCFTIYEVRSQKEEVR